LPFGVSGKHSSTTNATRRHLGAPSASPLLRRDDLFEVLRSIAMIPWNYF